ncbi:MAG: fluoride efflux transporter CrcB [Bacteroidaceae bacterium]|nr:fluoride efflux transporter CrcB [Bacteroidaceae bacterium]
MLKALFFVGMGSLSGGITRFLISKFVQSSTVLSFPLGTFVVNVLGCFAIGMFYGLFETGHLMNNNLRLFLTVGFCGGFTTFSTFMNENYLFLKDQNFFYLAIYTSLSLFVGLIMLYVGYSIIKLL